MNPDPFELRPVELADVDALFTVYRDAATWQHLPSGRFTERASMSRLVLRWTEEWSRHGLSTWVVVVDGEVVGNCGVMPRDGWWNLGFRLAPSVWGRGVATRAARSAVESGQAHRPEWPVVARSLASNPASGHVSEKVGLREVWRGPAVEEPDLVVHADRPLTPSLLTELRALG